ncbi:MAG: hypothetical protein Tsb009_29440 [Planctomycetaceae bacterium]
MAERKIGPFLLKNQLGVGGMGVVYRATYEKTGQDVAVKVLSPVMSADKGVRQRFQREMEILKRLDHKNIVRYFGGGTKDEQIFYAMEIMDGGSLEDVLKKRGRLSWEQTIDVAKAVTRGLEYAHNKGIIHRDLKPGNLFLTKKGHLKLGDFGIARDTQRTALTAAGKTVGTYAYMAPEQIAGKPPVSRKTDLYALGCVMFQMLTGRVPFEAENAGEMLMQHLELKPPRVTAHCPDCPIWLEKVIEKLLSKEPDDRFYDARALRMALNEVGTKVSEQASIAKQTVAGDATVVATTGDNQELKKLLGKKKKRKRKKKTFTPIYERAWFLGLCLTVLIAAVTWAVWPMSNEERFARGKELMEQAMQLAEDDEDRPLLMMEAREKYFEPIVESDPEGDLAKKAEQYLFQIETETVHRQVENRIRLDREPKSEAERSYMRARRSQKRGDRITALDQYRSLITLLKDREKARSFVALAKKRIAEIQSEGSDANTAREIILEGMQTAEKHLEKGRTIEADQVYSAIINNYQDNRELAPLVQKAREARRELQGKKKSTE